MPRAKIVPTNSGKTEGGYINYKVTETDRDEIRVWCQEAAELWEQVARLLDSQYQFKVSYDKNNDCYACYISGHWQLNKPDAAWTLTGRGSSWEKALRQALWIHWERFGGDWSQAKRSNVIEKSWD